jgi:hypothetical protein
LVTVVVAMVLGMINILHARGMSVKGWNTEVTASLAFRLEDGVVGEEWWMGRWGGNFVPNWTIFFCFLCLSVYNICWVLLLVRLCLHLMNYVKVFHHWGPIGLLAMLSFPESWDLISCIPKFSIHCFLFFFKVCLFSYLF